MQKSCAFKVYHPQRKFIFKQLVAKNRKNCRFSIIIGRNGRNEKHEYSYHRVLQMNLKTWMDSFVTRNASQKHNWWLYRQRSDGKTGCAVGLRESVYQKGISSATLVGVIW